MDHLEIFRQNINAAYVASGKSIAALIRETHLSRNAVKAILSGQTNPRIDTLIILCDAIDISPADLFLEKAQKSSKNTASEEKKMREMMHRLIDVVPDLKAEELAYIFQIDQEEAKTIIEEEGAV